MATGIKTIVSTKELNKKGVLSSLIERTLRAESKDTTRPYMSLGFWDSQAQALVATDGKRMHILEGELITEFFADIKDDVFVEQSNGFVMCYDKAFGFFPNWKGVVPDPLTCEGPEGDFDLTDKKAFNANITSMIIALGRKFNFSYLEGLKGGTYKVSRMKPVEVTADTSKAVPVPICTFEEEGSDFKFTAMIVPYLD